MGLTGSKPIGGGFELRTGAGYSWGTERWSYAARLRRDWERAGRIRLSAAWRKGTEQRYRSETYSRLTNSAAFLLGLNDYFDYQWTELFTAAASYQPASWQKTGIFLSFRSEDQTSLANTTSFTFLDRDRRYRSNAPVTSGTLRSLTLTFDRGASYTPFGLASNRRLRLEVEHSADWLRSDHSFTRFDVVFDWHMKTFLKTPRRPECP